MPMNASECGLTNSCGHWLSHRHSTRRLPRTRNARDSAASENRSTTQGTTFSFYRSKICKFLKLSRKLYSIYLFTGHTNLPSSLTRFAYHYNHGTSSEQALLRRYLFVCSCDRFLLGSFPAIDMNIFLKEKKYRLSEKIQTQGVLRIQHCPSSKTLVRHTRLNWRTREPKFRAN